MLPRPEPGCQRPDWAERSQGRSSRAQRAVQGASYINDQGCQRAVRRHIVGVIGLRTFANSSVRGVTLARHVARAKTGLSRGLAAPSRADTVPVCFTLGLRAVDDAARVSGAFLTRLRTPRLPSREVLFAVGHRASNGRPRGHRRAATFWGQERSLGHISRVMCAWHAPCPSSIHKPWTD